MARNVNEVIKALPTSRQRRIKKQGRLLISEELTLQELRRTREMTQASVAKKLGVAQKQVSEIEKRTDMYLSTLRRSIEAMGGTLKLVAEFPDREPVAIRGLADLAR